MGKVKKKRQLIFWQLFSFPIKVMSKFFKNVLLTNDLRTLISMTLISFRRRDWKWMKKIILEYSSIPLFESFNGRNWKLISLFESLSGRKRNGYEGTLILLYSFKISNFHSSWNWEEWEGMKLDLIIFLLKLPKYPYVFNLFILK